jgi:hypothetical protein
MLDWARCTLTHSSGAAVVPVLAPPLFFGLAFEGLVVEGLVFGLGLVATWASSAAAVADVPEVPDGDDADDDVDGEVVWRGALLTLVGGLVTLADWLAGGSVTLADWLAGGVAVPEWLAGGLVGGGLVGDEEDGDGEGEGDGDGDGDGVADDGSAWHTLSALAVVAVGAACAVPSTPRVRKLPLSKVTAATLTCAKRMRIACLRCSSGLPCALS